MLLITLYLNTDTYPEFLELDVLFFYHSEKAFEVFMVEENVDRNAPD